MPSYTIKNASHSFGNDPIIKHSWKWGENGILMAIMMATDHLLYFASYFLKLITSHVIDTFIYMY